MIKHLVQSIVDKNYRETIAELKGYGFTSEDLAIAVGKKYPDGYTGFLNSLLVAIRYYTVGSQTKSFCLMLNNLNLNRSGLPEKVRTEIKKNILRSILPYLNLDNKDIDSIVAEVNARDIIE